MWLRSLWVRDQWQCCYGSYLSTINKIRSLLIYYSPPRHVHWVHKVSKEALRMKTVDLVATSIASVSRANESFSFDWTWRDAR